MDSLSKSRAEHSMLEIYHMTSTVLEKYCVVQDKAERALKLMLGEFRNITENLAPYRKIFTSVDVGMFADFANMSMNFESRLRSIENQHANYDSRLGMLEQQLTASLNCEDLNEKYSPSCSPVPINIDVQNSRLVSVLDRMYGRDCDVTQPNQARVPPSENRSLIPVIADVGSIPTPDAVFKVKPPNEPVQTDPASEAMESELVCMVSSNKDSPLSHQAEENLDLNFNMFAKDSSDTAHAVPQTSRSHTSCFEEIPEPVITIRMRGSSYCDADAEESLPKTALLPKNTFEFPSTSAVARPQVTLKFNVQEEAYLPPIIPMSLQPLNHVPSTSKWKPVLSPVVSASACVSNFLSDIDKLESDIAENGKYMEELNRDLVEKRKQLDKYELRLNSFTNEIKLIQRLPEPRESQEYLDKLKDGVGDAATSSKHLRKAIDRKEIELADAENASLGLKIKLIDAQEELHTKKKAVLLQMVQQDSSANGRNEGLELLKNNDQELQNLQTKKNALLDHLSKQEAATSVKKDEVDLAKHNHQRDATLEQLRVLKEGLEQMKESLFRVRRHKADLKQQLSRVDVKSFVERCRLEAKLRKVDSLESGQCRRMEAKGRAIQKAEYTLRKLRELEEKLNKQRESRENVSSKMEERLLMEKRLTDIHNVTLLALDTHRSNQIRSESSLKQMLNEFRDICQYLSPFREFFAKLDLSVIEQYNTVHKRCDRIESRLRVIEIRTGRESNERSEDGMTEKPINTFAPLTKSLGKRAIELDDESISGIAVTAACAQDRVSKRLKFTMSDTLLNRIQSVRQEAKEKDAVGTIQADKETTISLTAVCPKDCSTLSLHGADLAQSTTLQAPRDNICPCPTHPESASGMGDKLNDQASSKKHVVTDSSVTENIPVATLLAIETGHTSEASACARPGIYSPTSRCSPMSPRPSVEEEPESSSTVSSRGATIEKLAELVEAKTAALLVSKDKAESLRKKIDTIRERKTNERIVPNRNHFILQLEKEVNEVKKEGLAVLKSIGEDEVTIQKLLKEVECEIEQKKKDIESVEDFLPLMMTHLSNIVSEKDNIVKNLENTGASPKKQLEKDLKSLEEKHQSQIARVQENDMKAQELKDLLKELEDQQTKLKALLIAPAASSCSNIGVPKPGGGSRGRGSYRASDDRILREKILRPFYKRRGQWRRERY